LRWGVPTPIEHLEIYVTPLFPEYPRGIPYVPLPPLAPQDSDFILKVAGPSRVRPRFPDNEEEQPTMHTKRQHM
jgi:hypothetical protein